MSFNIKTQDVLYVTLDCDLEPGFPDTLNRLVQLGRISSSKDGIVTGKSLIPTPTGDPIPTLLTLVASLNWDTKQTDYV